MFVYFIIKKEQTEINPFVPLFVSKIKLSGMRRKLFYMLCKMN